MSILWILEVFKMNKKYEFTDETITIKGHVLHRIKAVIDFDFVRAGNLGGFIEKEENLSHFGGSWIDGDACVFDNAKVYHNALVRNHAQVFGNARIYGNSIVVGNAKVYGNSAVCGLTQIYGNAIVCDHAAIYDRALIYDKAQVCGYARIYGDATICGNAYVSNQTHICGNTRCTTNIDLDLKESIRVQTGLLPVGDEVIAYKQVRKSLKSFYDHTFKYEVGKVAVAKDTDESNRSCASGLHFANANYWNSNKYPEESTFLIAKIKLEDIITVQEGKIRCRKAEIIGTYDIKQ
jgi:carbonic anhydrase/acetyltransferase-like protein (isoleucine patch superfamily)